jgi:hypothetical protein
LRNKVTTIKTNNEEARKLNKSSNIIEKSIMETSNPEKYRLM